MCAWIDLPPPPSPTGISQFPANPTEVVLFQTRLPDRRILLYGLPYEIRNISPSVIVNFLHGYTFNPIATYIDCSNLTIKVIGRWEQLISGTATPHASFTHTKSVTSGTTLTDTVTSTFGLTLGVKPTPIEVGQSLSLAIGRSVALTQSETLSTAFSSSSKAGERVSTTWWQKVIEYRLDGQLLVTERPRLWDLLGVSLLDRRVAGPQLIMDSIINRENLYIPTSFSNE